MARVCRSGRFGFGFEGEPGLGEEPVDERRPVLDAFEPVLHDGGQLVNGAGGEVAQAVLHVRRTPLAGLRSGAQAGRWMTVSQSRRAPASSRMTVLIYVFRLSQIKMTGAFSWRCDLGQVGHTP